MKIRIILSHPASELFGEIREAVIAQELVRQGHDAAIYRVYGGSDFKRDVFADTVPVVYFPADDRSAAPHRSVSTALRDALAADRPDAIVFKGIGYDIVPFILAALAASRPKIGFILGGNAVEPELAAARFVFAESGSQMAAVRTAAGDGVACRILPKFIDWTVADRVHAERQGHAPHYDIINVGTFEARKNQIALRPFFGRFSIAMIGSGEMQDEVAAAAAGHDRIRLLGALPNADVLAQLGRARLMVHSSLWEGVPRALIESLACGTPVVAHAAAIQGSFGEGSGVRLVGTGELEAAVAGLLGDPGSLRQFGEEGRRFAQREHGAHRLLEAAQHMVEMAAA
ncbi:glycosyltransferase family 4 protein [Roseicella sp. DB1501]|uniref:glycosyltransferase family 4 protein n=1 Tax=Roseicella sp. DB1501 TaxID=2730925 RepID=UPI0014927FF5|nr:glycosyltransferase family 4 protein [Roseicella sp. DB1501]NOG73987.1 glycosyltransferase family 4 protein [Roseicella sp. DB1501]